MEKRKGLPRGWLKMDWLVMYTQQDPLNIVNEPDLYLWIKQTHYPSLTIPQYRVAIRRMVTHLGAGYKNSGLPDEVANPLNAHICTLGRKAWGFQTKLLELEQKEGTDTSSTVCREPIIPKSNNHGLVENNLTQHKQQTSTFQHLSVEHSPLLNVNVNIGNHNGETPLRLTKESIPSNPPSPLVDHQISQTEILSIHSPKTKLSGEKRSISNIWSDSCLFEDCSSVGSKVPMESVVREFYKLEDSPAVATKTSEPSSPGTTEISSVNSEISNCLETMVKSFYALQLEEDTYSILCNKILQYFREPDNVGFFVSPKSRISKKRCALYTNSTLKEIIGGDISKAFIPLFPNEILPLLSSVLKHTINDPNALGILKNVSIEGFSGTLEVDLFFQLQAKGELYCWLRKAKVHVDYCAQGKQEPFCIRLCPGVEL